MVSDLPSGYADNYWNREINKSKEFNEMFNNIGPCVMKFGIYEPLYHPGNSPLLPPKDVYQIPLSQDYLNNSLNNPLPKLELGKLEQKIEENVGLLKGAQLGSNLQKPVSSDFSSPIKDKIDAAAQGLTKVVLEEIKSNSFFKPKPLDIAPPYSPPPLKVSNELAPIKPDLSDPKIELAPLVRDKESEAVFKGVGNVHFSFENHDKFVGFHATTQIPGLGKKEGFPYGLSLHTRIKIEKDNTLSFFDMKFPKKTWPNEPGGIE